MSFNTSNLQNCSVIANSREIISDFFFFFNILVCLLVTLLAVRSWAVQTFRLTQNGCYTVRVMLLTGLILRKFPSVMSDCYLVPLKCPLVEVFLLLCRCFLPFPYFFTLACTLFNNLFRRIEQKEGP